MGVWRDGYEAVCLTASGFTGALTSGFEFFEFRFCGVGRELGIGGVWFFSCRECVGVRGVNFDTLGGFIGGPVMRDGYHCAACMNPSALECTGNLLIEATFAENARYLQACVFSLGIIRQTLSRRPFPGQLDFIESALHDVKDLLENAVPKEPNDARGLLEFPPLVPPAPAPIN